MLGTSTALTTAPSSTSHMSAILRLFASVTGRSLRSTSASGWMPIERSVATECCVGLVFCSPEAPMNGTSETCTKKTFVAAELVADLARRLDERLRLDVADRAADLGDDDVGLRLSSACRRMRRLISSVMCGMTCTVSPRYSPRRSRAMTCE